MSSLNGSGRTDGFSLVLVRHSSVASRLEQLKRIAVRVFHLNLFAARSDFHLIFKTHSFLFRSTRSAGKSST